MGQVRAANLKANLGQDLKACVRSKHRKLTNKFIHKRGRSLNYSDMLPSLGSTFTNYVTLWHHKTLPVCSHGIEFIWFHGKMNYNEWILKSKGGWMQSVDVDATLTFLIFDLTEVMVGYQFSIIREIIYCPFMNLCV